MYSLVSAHFLGLLLIIFLSFVVGMAYSVHGLESEVIGYLEQYGCPTETDKPE